MTYQVCNRRVTFTKVGFVFRPLEATRPSAYFFCGSGLTYRTAIQLLVTPGGRTTVVPEFECSQSEAEKGFLSHHAVELR